jgi:hypothetical protein
MLKYKSVSDYVICLQCPHIVWAANSYNLLSVNQLTKKQCSVAITHTHCIFQDLSMKRRIGLGNVHEGLYYFQSSSAFLVTGLSQIDVWHWQLGHLSSQQLQQLDRDFDSISCSAQRKELPCEIYLPPVHQYN